MHDSSLKLVSDISRPDKLSCAQVASICQAAGLQAVRKNRYVILPIDFDEAWKSVVKKGDDTHDFCESVRSKTLFDDCADITRRSIIIIM